MSLSCNIGKSVNRWVTSSFVALGSGDLVEAFVHLIVAHSRYGFLLLYYEIYAIINMCKSLPVNLRCSALEIFN